VSVGGIGEEGELYDFNDEEVVARQALVASAEVNVLVVDSTKFGRRAMCRNGDIGDFHYVVSDRAPPAPSAICWHSAARSGCVGKDSAPQRTVR
jgi:DeoR family glycerol-3-phosphate regulon repressor